MLPDYRIRRTLPIFPLNVVALPAASVPLMIFEARYRVLFSTLLDGMDGIEEGLVQKDADWCGTKRFGMCYVDNEGRMASTGCTLVSQPTQPNSTHKPAKIDHNSQDISHLCLSVYCYRRWRNSLQ